VLGSSLQTVRKLMDDGWIGNPIGALAIRIYGGPETWHPNPGFLYRKGAGPLYDTGPYSIAGLSYLLGPVESTAFSSKMTYSKRTILSQPLYGQTIDVEVPTFITGSINFKSGAIASLTLSFDVPCTRHGSQDIEIYGTDGTISVPAFTAFGGKVELKRRNDSDWLTIPNLNPYVENSRGIGIAEMASAIKNNRQPRLTPEMAYHILDVLIGIEESCLTGRTVRVESTFTKTPPLPLALVKGKID